jgi:hypothetical protein
MMSSTNHAIDRQGLDQDFAAQDAKKSALLLEAQLLRAQDRDEAAAIKLAEAAHIEERLAEYCVSGGLRERAWLHRFSAASCWAQAGNFYQAITWCEDLLAQPDLSDSLRLRVLEYAQQLRARRAQWYRDLSLATAER